MTRVRVDAAAVAALARDPGVLRGTGEVADAVASRMAQRAPKDTGEAARSIHAERDPAEPGFLVSWDAEHYYLAYHELGSQHQPARPFARPTADEFTSRR